MRSPSGIKKRVVQETPRLSEKSKIMRNDAINNKVVFA